MSQPPPLPPFLLARDVETEPGIHSAQDVLALRRENHRLRRERDAALDGTPPPTRGQRRAQVALGLGKFAVLLPVAAVLARWAGRNWPEYAELVDSVLSVVGL